MIQRASVMFSHATKSITRVSFRQENVLLLMD
jgi:hypothetical protein